MELRSYSIESFGCQMNLSDSERIAGQLESLGYAPAKTNEQADVIVMNTCCVRESAENRIFGHIGALKRLKEVDSRRIIIVAGCLAQKDQAAIFRRAPHVDIVLGTQNIDRLAEILLETEHKKHRVVSDECAGDGLGYGMRKSRNPGVSAWIPIMYGCDNFCSYCIVPYVRGRERSRPPEEILAEIRLFVFGGGKEVTLLGQNVNSYGKNLADAWDFPRLLSAVDKIDGITRVRFMTSHPKDLSDRLIQVMAEGKNICRHLHLPVQSGCDEILRRMNRKYSSENYRSIVGRLRSAIPDISLTTDLIVGFPGETDAMFAETLAFVKEMRFDAAFTFLYSRRSGTPAAELPDQVPGEKKHERLQMLMDLQNNISLELNRRWVGQTVEVLADGPSKTAASTYSGRTGQNKIVLWPATDADCPGVIQKISIESAQSFLIKGKPAGKGTE